MSRLEVDIDRLEGKRRAYDPDDIVRGGAFVILDHDGEVRIERGFIRPEDEKPRTDAAGGQSRRSEPVRGIAYGARRAGSAEGHALGPSHGRSGCSLRIQPQSSECASYRVGPHLGLHGSTGPAARRERGLSTDQGD
jgi:hypothetical protein